MDEAQSWAAEQFGHAELGDPRRTRRLVHVGAEVVKRRSSIVSRACGTSASREGAFRFLENPHVRSEAIRDAICAATREVCRGKGTVVVALDGSAVSIARGASKGLGAVGRWKHGVCGFHAMTALAVASDGTPLGICAQEKWIRERRSPNKYGHVGAEGETRFWLAPIESVVELFEGIGARPWFQADRGADCWRVLALAMKLDALITVRATHDRILETGGRLWPTLQRAPIRAKTVVDVRGRPPTTFKRKKNGKTTYVVRRRRERQAKLVIRAARVGLRCQVSPRKHETLPINAVFVSEPGVKPSDRIEWMLLTTHPIETTEDLLEIVRAYALRWRIEDFHRAWKGGLCGIEQTELRSREAIYKWATILAAVATRAMRLTHLARQTPDALASTEFSPYELRAILIQRQPKGFDSTAIPTITLGQAIRWIADTAGYNGPWKGPPGVTIIGRGLQEIELIAKALELNDKMR